MKAQDLQPPEGTSVAACPRAVCFCAKEIINAENEYCARSWDRELATRYVFGLENATVEASYFRHYQSDEFVKDVLELPVSYGCVVGCRHCASSQLRDIRFLLLEELLTLFGHVAGRHVPIRTYRFRVSFAGIGESALRPHLIDQAIPRMLALYPNCYFTLTTSGCDPEFIPFVDTLAQRFPVEYLQITHLHDDVVRLSKIIPTVSAYRFDLKRSFKAIEHTSVLAVRLNYVLIEDFNDDIATASRLADCVWPVRDKVIVRISRMNETTSSRTYGLQPPSMETLQVIRDTFGSRGITSYVFASHRDDNLNCGQLAGTYQ